MKLALSSIAALAVVAAATLPTVAHATDGTITINGQIGTQTCTINGNGTGGSDHGTGSVAFLAGGGVKGGRVIGNWPGLAESQLYQNRDLYPDNDIRSLIKAVLAQHLAIPGGTIDQTIFPQSTGVAAYPGLFA